MNERYTLTITTERCDVPTAIRLRRLLKAALRVYRFRCECITCNVPAKNGTESNRDAFSAGGMTSEPSEGAECGKTAKERQQQEVEVF